MVRDCCFMFNRSLPPWFWLLFGCVISPALNGINTLLVLYFINSTKATFDQFSISYLLNLFSSFPLGLFSMIAANHWQIGSYKTTRFICFGIGITALLLLAFLFYIFSITLMSFPNSKGMDPSDFTITIQFLLPAVWSLALILTSFLLRAPRHN